MKELTCYCVCTNLMIFQILITACPCEKGLRIKYNSIKYKYINRTRYKLTEPLNIHLQNSINKCVAYTISSNHWFIFNLVISFQFVNSSHRQMKQSEHNLSRALIQYVVHSRIITQIKPNAQLYSDKMTIVNLKSSIEKQEIAIYFFWEIQRT